ncbi:O-methyltransferase [Rhizobium leguminosarum]|uniref:O-methyltransferase n=1 Tax=Rhizobium leguminosarum TaxID=384 RepID=UPI003F9DB912
MSSFRKINYSLRPAKHAERRMLGDVFRRLSHFEVLEDYVYVGFGSVWFTDFVLYHKMLGIRDMISIEEASGARDRFEANRPFNIDIVFQKSNVALPKLDWARRQIVWLDYDGTLSIEMLLDARTVAAKARSGSIIAISVQCNEAADVEDSVENPNGPNALDRFVQRFGRERVPQGTTEEDLYGWRFGKLSRDLIAQEIETALSTRNASGEQHFAFHPITSINYQDDAKMTTIVGVIVENAEVEKFAACQFERLDFLQGRQQPIKIEVPKLTGRELKHIERQLPLSEGVQIDLAGGIPGKDARLFIEMYRYFPNFAVVEA